MFRLHDEIIETHNQWRRIFSHEFSVYGSSTTRNVTVFSRPLRKFKKMGIVYATLFYRPCSPIKRCLTHCTPHLGTSIYFMNHRGAFGTWSGISVDEFHRFHEFWITHVTRETLFVTLITKRFFAYSTFP